MPRTGASPLHAPEVHVEPSSHETAPPHRAQPAYDSAPGHGATLSTVSVLSPAGMSGGRVLVRSVSRRTAWPAAYALSRRAGEYISTPERNVFVERDSGQTVVFHGERPFAVLRDPDDGSWRLMAPRDPARRGPPIRRNAGGEWEIDPGVRPRTEAGDARAAAQRPAPAAATNAPSARPTGSRPVDRMAEYVLKYPDRDPAPIARELGLTRELTRQIATVVRAATREWYEVQRGGLQLRQSVIVAPPTTRERQFILKWGGELSSRTLARMMQTPSEVIDSFLDRTLGAERARLSDQTAPAPVVPSRALMEWCEVIRADVADGQRASRVSLTDAAAAFAAQWRGRLSERNIVAIMTSYRAAPDPGLPRASQAAANHRVVPRAGSSGHQGPLNDAQRAQAIDLNNQGMSPDTIAAYVGKPREMVEAFLLERPR